MVKVAHVRKAKFDHYMGRSCAEFHGTPFGNPFYIGSDGDREEVLMKFIHYWYAPEQSGLRQLAFDSIGPESTLGCWCHPLPCHCDIIAGYLNWKFLPSRLF